MNNWGCWLELGVAPGRQAALGNTQLAGSGRSRVVAAAAAGKDTSKGHERQGRDLFSSFEGSDIWNKEASYVSCSFWDRQTDRGQILPARQSNRPRRVGSLWDDSFIHTHTRTHTGNKEHTHTHTRINCSHTKLSLRLQMGKVKKCNRAEQRGNV